MPFNVRKIIATDSLQRAQGLLENIHQPMLIAWERHTQTFQTLIPAIEAIDGDLPYFISAKEIEAVWTNLSPTAALFILSKNAYDFLPTKTHFISDGQKNYKETSLNSTRMKAILKKVPLGIYAAPPIFLSSAIDVIESKLDKQRRKLSVENAVDEDILEKQLRNKQERLLLYQAAKKQFYLFSTPAEKRLQAQIESLSSKLNAFKRENALSDQIIQLYRDYQRRALLIQREKEIDESIASIKKTLKKNWQQLLHDPVYKHLLAGPDSKKVEAERRVKGIESTIKNVDAAIKKFRSVVKTRKELNEVHQVIAAAKQPEIISEQTHRENLDKLLSLNQQRRIAQGELDAINKEIEELKSKKQKEYELANRHYFLSIAEFKDRKIKLKVRIETLKSRLKDFQPNTSLEEKIHTLDKYTQAYKDTKNALLDVKQEVDNEIHFAQKEIAYFDQLIETTNKEIEILRKQKTNKSIIKQQASIIAIYENKYFNDPELCSKKYAEYIYRKQQADLFWCILLAIIATPLSLLITIPLMMELHANEGVVEKREVSVEDWIAFEAFETAKKSEKKQVDEEQAEPFEKFKQTVSLSDGRKHYRFFMPPKEAQAFDKELTKAKEERKKREAQFQKECKNLASFMREMRAAGR